MSSGCALRRVQAALPRGHAGQQLRIIDANRSVVSAVRSLLPSARTVLADATGTASRLLHTSGRGSSAVLAVSFNWGHAPSVAKFPPPYGHIWAHAHHFWRELVEPRLRPNASPRWATVVLPAGFEELAALWTSNATRLHVVTAPWVPLCLATMTRTVASAYCCWSIGAPPQRDERAAVLAGFPNHAAAPRAPARWADFRAAAWASLGVEPREAMLAAQPRRPPAFVWVLSAGVNGRRLSHEGTLVRRVRALVASLSPPWTFTLLTPHAPLREELRAIATASVVTSLFGSALHNVRFMPPGSLAVEVHGALKNDFGRETDYLYRDLCAAVGVRWVGYATPGFRPPPPNASAAERSQYAYATARVDADDFVGFVEHVLRGAAADDDSSLSALRAEYDRQVRAHPDPREAATAQAAGRSRRPPAQVNTPAAVVGVNT